MKLINPIRLHFSNHELSSLSKVQSIDLQKLLRKFQKHFLMHYEKYQLPLLQSQGTLAYTNRFAKTVINIPEVNKDLKNVFFKKIKKSILRHNLTPQSSVSIMESLINFPFSGDQDPILEQLRNYALSHDMLLTSSQKDQFEMAYKYILVEKAEGKLKFIDCVLSKRKQVENSQFKDKLRFLFRENKITKYSLQDWNFRKQMRISLKIGNKERNLFLKGISSKSDIVLSAKRAVDLAKKDQFIILIKPFEASSISEENIKKYLLVDSSSTQLISAYPGDNQNNFFSAFIKEIKQNYQLPHNHSLFVSELSPIKYLNAILSHSSEIDLKESLGYLKFNAFHLELERILLMINMERKENVKEIFPLNLPFSLELQELAYSKIFTSIQIQAKQILELIEQKNSKSAHIYLKEDEIYTFLFFFLKYTEERKIESQFDQEENKNISTLKNKLALVSTIYNFELNLPLLSKQADFYRKLLYPLTS